MNHILNYKIYEGVYNNTISEINKKKEEISELKSKYKLYVDDCMSDITDKYNMTYSGFPRDDEGDHEYGEFELCYSIEINVSDINDFMDNYDEVSKLIKSYIGLDINIESIWCPDLFRSIGNDSVDLCNQLKKLNLIEQKKLINDLFSPLNKDTLLEIILVINP